MKTQEADFRAFRAWRYDLQQISLSKVIAPPYDVISPREQDALYSRSPFNVVRLILGKEPDFYDQARKRWEDWGRQGILIQDKQPAIYLYQQEFCHPLNAKLLCRTAVIGILKLEEPGAVFRHEATFEGPKRDRLSLLEKVKTNLSPIFGLYRDSKKVASVLASAYRDRPPLFEARDEQGVFHRGWAIENEKDQKRVRETLKQEKILIADGHHRYETAVEYQKQMRKNFPGPPEAPYDFVMMALVALEDEGLLMLPTHRILRTLAPISKETFRAQLKNHFDFVPFPPDKLFETLTSQPAHEKVLGVIFDKESFLLRLKNKDEVRYEMEVNLLSHLVFDTLWGVPPEKRPVEYTHFDQEAVLAVQSGKAEAAFLLRAPAIDTVRELAYAGERLPQKTTYFYPKLASGLFFYHHG